MFKNLIKIIHELRHVFLLLILLGFFVVAGLNPLSISYFLGAKLSRSVGMSVSVPENPFNKLALELKEKENELNRREAALKFKEQATDDNSLFFSQRNLILFLMVGIVFLFILLIINFYLDFRRRKIKN